MKTSSHLFRASDLLGLGALVVFAGCTNLPMRQSTVAFESEYAPSAVATNGLGYQAPVPLHTVMPIHPWEMRRWGIAGGVDVNVLIDESGKVIDAQVERSSDTAFEEPALKAVKQWTFKPALQNGVPYTTRASIPIKFEFTN